MDHLDLISLIALCLTIVAAFVFKVNTGILSIAVALVLGRCAGLSDKTLIGFFDSNLFLMLLGVMYLFCIAQENKTLDLLAKKVLALCRGKVKLFPPILFLFSAILSAVGPGLISVTALMAVLIVAIANETNTSPIKLLPFGVLGSFAGGLSPIAPSGIVAINTATANGIEGLALPLMLKMALVNLLYAAILYFFVFKWHRQKNIPMGKKDNAERTPPFSAKQYITLAGIVVVAILAAFQVNVGLAAFAVAVVLTVLRVADEGAAMKKVPWNTLIMIAGVGILISLVTELGGIKLLSKGLQQLMGKHTAAAIMSILAGVMSWFSSASGVVMPTLIPTVPGIATSLSGVTMMELTVGLCMGAHLAALSPLSSCGGLSLAAYSSSEGVTAKDRNKMFAQLFILSACGVLFCGLLAFTGLYK